MGTVPCRACKGSGRFYAKSGKSFDCKACGGSGTNASLWSTRCQSCRTEIIYKAYTDEPKFCRDCRNKDLEKTCQTMGCNNTIRYKLGWVNVSDFCRYCDNKMKSGFSASRCPGTGMLGCGKVIWSPPGKTFKLCSECGQRQKAENEAKWREKSCPGLKGQTGCGKTIRYRTDWDNIPDICPDCREKAKSAKEDRQKREKVFWPANEPLPGSDRSLNDLRRVGVTGVSVLKEPTGGYHVTLYNSDGRYSYGVDRNGNFESKSAHSTDEAAKLLGKDTIGQDATNKNRW